MPNAYGCCVPLVLTVSTLILGIACAGTPSDTPIAPEVAECFTLIENGGFESGDALPDWWGRHPREDQGQQNLHRRDTEEAHSGEASALVQWLEPIAGENKSPLQWSRYYVDVEGATELLVSGYVKTDGVEAARVGANLYDADGEYVGFKKVGLPTNPSDWTHFTGTLPISPEVVKMGFVLYTARGGRTWYDDIAVLGTPSTEAVRGTPNIDGRLDDACWQEAHAITQFVHYKGIGLAKEPTQAWIAYDDERLYVAFQCAFPAGSSLKHDATEYDGETWLDDSVEVFLDPWHRHNDYYQFALNCRGALRDAHAARVSWDSNAEVAVAREETAWTVELAIPFADLALDFDVDTVWGVNLVRNDRVSGETVTWSLGGFHNAARFGNVTLAPDLMRLMLPELAERGAALKQQHGRLKDEMARVGLSAESVPQAYSLLDGARAQSDDLQWLASGQASLEGVTVAQMRTQLDDIRKAIAEARAAALNAPFAIRESGDGGFSVAVAGSMQKVFRKRPVTDGLLVNQAQLEAAQDETESFQLVVVPNGQALDGVTVEAKPLQGPGGAIPVEWHVVGYVETGTPKYETEHVGWWPDVLMPPAPFNVAKDERQPLWFRVSVPPEATPGAYHGEVTIRCGDHEEAVPVELRVRPFRLPRPGTLACPFGLYAHALSRWYNGKKYYQDVMPVETFARWCEFMGQYRLTPKNMANEYHKRTSEEDGKRLDLSLLQQTVAPLASTYYPPHSFCVFRLPCPRDVQDGTTTKDPAVWVNALKERAAEYTRLGLPHEAYVYGIDEPLPSGYPFVRKVYEMVREATPEFPIMQTVNHGPPAELVDVVDIWCPLSARIDDPLYRERKEAGDTLWMYVCCSPKPPYANFFIDQPAIDHRMVFWQAKQAGATGLLYWCLCWWAGIPGPPDGEPHFPEVPVQLDGKAETLTRLGTNGDGILVWPGPDMTPYPSIRLENVRDGIEDYEYLALLERVLADAKELPEEQRPDKAVLREAEALCLVPREICTTFTEFTKDPQVFLARRNAIGDMIEKLTAAK